MTKINKGFFFDLQHPHSLFVFFRRPPMQAYFRLAALGAVLATTKKKILKARRVGLLGYYHFRVMALTPPLPEKDKILAANLVSPSLPLPSDRSIRSARRICKPKFDIFPGRIR